MSIFPKKQQMVKSNGTFIVIIGLITLWGITVTLKGTLQNARVSVQTLQTSKAMNLSVTANQTRPVSMIKKECVEKTRIAFIKVHKAASTTITSIIQRYGLNHNLTFALPLPRDPYHIGLFKTFDPSNVRPLPKGKVYEALCQHVVYNREAFQKYMPKDMTIIAAVREPFSRFVSAFQYFREYNRTVSSRAHISENSVALMREFLKSPEYYEPSMFKDGSLVYNRMAFDLGIPKSQYSNNTFVDQYIRQLDKDMTLVLIADHFDQSLVLLKRIMCWSTKDILYQIRNKGSGTPQLPEDLKSTHRLMVPVEYRIYDYFLQKFITLYTNEVDIDKEVRLFQYTRNRIEDFCSSQSKQLMVHPTKFDKGFNFTQTDCHFMKMKETVFVAHLSKLQKA